MRLISQEEFSHVTATLPSDVLSKVRDELLHDPLCGPALSNYLAIAHRLIDQGLTDEDRFYNAYFWFRRFALLYQASHGADAGIEQQAIQILENAAVEVDWNLIDSLDEKARTVEGQRSSPK